MNCLPHLEHDLRAIHQRPILPSAVLIHHCVLVLRLDRLPCLPLLRIDGRSGWKGFINSQIAISQKKLRMPRAKHVEDDRCEIDESLVNRGLLCQMSCVMEMYVGWRYAPTIALGATSLKTSMIWPDKRRYGSRLT